MFVWLAVAVPHFHLVPFTFAIACTVPAAGYLLYCVRHFLIANGLALYFFGLPLMSLLLRRLTRETASIRGAASVFRLHVRRRSKHCGVRTRTATTAVGGFFYYRKDERLAMGAAGPVVGRSSPIMSFNAVHTSCIGGRSL